MKLVKLRRVAVAVAVVAAVASMLGTFGKLEYCPMKNDVAPLGRVTAEWPTVKENLLQLAKVEFAQEGAVLGPESIEFDPQGKGPYTGLGDGRIVRWRGNSWETFALPTSEWTRERCDTGNNTRKRTKNEHVCGRPLGLRFDTRSGKLYIADSYHGLLVVGPEGGVAKPLVTQVDGLPIKFANDLDVHPNGSVFFTDTSMRWNRRLHHMAILEGENTGRLIRYDPDTNKAVVVLRGLAFPNGVQLAKDHSFILVAETTNCRVLRYWIRGKLTGKVEVFADLPGYPDNVRINDKGEFWVAIDCCRNRIQELLSSRPWLKSLVYKLPVPLSWIIYGMSEKLYSVAAKFDTQGRLLHRLEDRESKVVKLISEATERDGKLWFGTVVHDRIASLSLAHPKLAFSS